MEHEDIMIDVLRKAMIQFQKEEAYANPTQRNLVMLDLIRYREILYSQNSNQKSAMKEVARQISSSI